LVSWRHDFSWCSLSTMIMSTDKLKSCICYIHTSVAYVYHPWRLDGVMGDSSPGESDNVVSHHRRYTQHLHFSNVFTTFNVIYISILHRWGRHLVWTLGGIYLKQSHYNSFVIVRERMVFWDQSLKILATDSYTVNPGQTVRVKTNIVVMHSLGDPAGFFTITNQHPGYWLHKQCSAKFYMKEGVVSTHYTGVILVSVLNKSTDNVMIRQGTTLGCLQFNRFI
jgi:dUTPase